MHYYSESLTSVHENPPSVGGCRVPALQLHLRKPASSLVPAGGQKTAQMVRGEDVQATSLLSPLAAGAAGACGGEGGRAQKGGAPELWGLCWCRGGASPRRHAESFALCVLDAVGMSGQDVRAGTRGGAGAGRGRAQLSFTLL